MSKNPRNEGDTDWSQSNFRKKRTNIYADVNNKNSVGNWFEDLYENHHVLGITLKLQPLLLAA